MAANQHDEDSPNDSSQEHPHTSLEDTGESPVLQEQETPLTQNNGTVKTAKSAVNPAVKATPGSPQAVAAALKKYAVELGDELRWKENLSLTSIDLQIGGPYFELWTK